MAVLAAYLFEVLLGNIIQFGLAATIGFRLRPRGFVLWIAAALLAMMLIGMSMDPVADPQRLTETFAASAAGLVIGRLVDTIRRRRAAAQAL